jgi:hypothetical protein
MCRNARSFIAASPLPNQKVLLELLIIILLSEWHVGMTADWKTDEQDLESRQNQELSFLHIVQTGPGAHPASYPMDTGAPFPCK